ncbi:MULTISPECIES: DUF262 domain-containing protein [Lactobacillus]|jgi:hypothetical protein|uniref:DUF262 domain-containing protein n=2 Tax=Lactobacillaceae TaxID=33958 RepID=UPI00069CE362|nr:MULTISPECIES: DUF262 domain-containing protein [Lactobacillus]OOK87379.1 hypothetical protein B0B48_06335 [Lactobacillus gasseri]VEF35747.1 Uncharacterized conserved protein [Lactobacillus paragasseri]
MKKSNKITAKKVKDAQRQIELLQKQVHYDTRDYPIEYLVNKYDDKTFFAPIYQRMAGVWDLHRKVRFIESIILGYPIPLLFLSDDEKSGKLEIVDGLQRISTLSDFFNNKLMLQKMDKLDKLNGFEFKDLPESEILRLKAYSLRVIVLNRTTDEETRIDLFNRINTSSLKATDSEVRSGTELLNPLMKLIKKLAKDKNFKKLTDLSELKLKRMEDIELISRFFAYSHNYKNFPHSVREFIDNYVSQFNPDNKEVKKFTKAIEKSYEEEFIKTFKFIDENYPQNIFKNKRNQTPRVRFEAISVGTNLALKTNPNLSVTKKQILDLVENKKFQRLTTSDGSNSKIKVKERIEYVKKYLLKESKYQA